MRNCRFFALALLAGCSTLPLNPNGLRPAVAPAVRDERFTVLVEGQAPLRDLVAAARFTAGVGDAFVNDGHFPPTSGVAGTVTLHLIHFGSRPVSTREALDGIRALGYRPADMRQLLAFEASLSAGRQPFPIVALGSVWTNKAGERFVPFVHPSGTRRFLFLATVDEKKYLPSDWMAKCRFLAYK